MKTFFLILYILLVIAGIVIIIDDNGNSGSKAFWLIVIAVLPVAGIVLYVLFGFNNRHHRIFNHHHRRYLEAFEKGADEELRERLFGDSIIGDVREKYHPLIRLLKGWYGPGVSGGNSMEILTTGKRKFELLCEDIKAAKEYIHLEYFRFANDESGRMIRDLLVAKAKEGVKVRFLHENIANYAIPMKYYDDMEREGIDLVRFSSPRKHLVRFITRLNYRNHRKIVVIDGRVGYTGGMNINDHYFKQWRDTHVRIEGEAVASLQLIFMDSWLTAGGTIDRPFKDYFPMPASTRGGIPVQITPDEPEAEWAILQMGHVWAIQHAKEYIWFQTPYFIPPEPLLEALKSAALSGVDVRIMIPVKSDTPLMGPANRSYFEECLQAGIKIYERQEPFMHSKTFVSDDYLSSIGSANLDYRSLQINYEDTAFFYDEATALRNKEIFLEDLALCSEVTLESLKSIPRLKRFWSKIVRLFSPML